MDGNPFDHVTEQLHRADQLPMLLAAAYVGLELADLTTQALTEQNHTDGFSAYVTAQFEAAEARDALSRAPSLTRPNTPPPAGRTTSPDIAASVAALAMVLAQILTAAAERSTDVADKLACLNAALHVGRLHEALR
jgi:hypothetical protein